MVQCLLVLLLLTAVVPLILSLPHGYYLIQESKTWNDAQAYCRDMYTDLATIDSDNDTIRIQSEAQKHQFSSGAWIGLYTNINSWHWSLDNTSLGGFTSWASGDPNNVNRDDRCCCISWEYISGTEVLDWGYWYDLPCTGKLPSMCFDASKNGSDRYIHIAETPSEYKTWYDAQSYCRQYYTDLASARDATENSIIKEKSIGWGTWIGLNRDPWKWSDQTSNISFISWSHGNADDYLKNKSCGYLIGGQVDLAPCSDTMPFYCYSPVKQRQMMKLKIKSSQDVNDPVIMAAMLEKIKQKLKDRGMSENITVKWRTQQDGVVFHKQEE